jgi:hypothetical protein
MLVSLADFKTRDYRPEGEKEGTGMQFELLMKYPSNSSMVGNTASSPAKAPRKTGERTGRESIAIQPL